MKKKILRCSILFVFIAVSFFVINPKVFAKSTEADSWNTYTNEKYGFSFNYPKAWENSEKEIAPESKKPGDPIFLVKFEDLSTDQKKSVFGGSPEEIAVFIRKKDSAVSLKDWLERTSCDKLIADGYQETDCEKAHEEIILGGEKGFVIPEGFYPPIGPIENGYAVEKGNYIYELSSISNFASGNDDPTQLPNFQEAVKTFKFADASTPANSEGVESEQKKTQNQDSSAQSPQKNTKTKTILILVIIVAMILIIADWLRLRFKR